MRRTILDLSTPGLFVTKSRGRLWIQNPNGDRASCVLDDLAAVIAGPKGSSWTQGAMAALAERGVPVVICGRGFLPVAIVWPVSGNHESGRRVRAQATISAPLKKRAWKQIVQSKIRLQARILQELGLPEKPVSVLVARVRSGDPQNMEAQASRRYWQILMGRDFRRARDAPGVNAVLNYGYTVLRSAMARAVCAAGLHPALSFSHSHPHNHFALVDDLLEPFRPFIDRCVYRLRQERGSELDVDNDTKQALVEVLHEPADTEVDRALLVDIYQAATSAALVVVGQDRYLDLPDTPISSRGEVGVIENPGVQNEGVVWLSDDVADRPV